MSERPVCSGEAGMAAACWRYLFDGAPSGIMVLGLDGRIVAANSACARQHGYAGPSEMQGMSWADLREGVETSRFEGGVAALPVGEVLAMEMDHRRSDGVRIRVRAEARKVELEGVVRTLVVLTDLTALKEAAEEVRRQEARLLLVLEAAELVTWELEIATGRLEYSKNLSSISGAEDVSPYLTLERFIDQVHPEDRAATRGAIERTMTTGCRFDCEYRVLLPDGSWHWLAGRGRAVAGSDGRWARVLGVSIDITRRKESDARYRSLVENSPDGLLVVDPVHGYFLAANPAAVRLYGASSESELMAATPWQLSPDTQPDGRSSESAAREHVEAAVREGCCSFQWTHRRLGGDEFLANVQLVRVQEHGLSVLQATVRDITSQVRAQEALSDEVMRRRILVEGSRDGIAVVDETGAVFEANRRFAEMLGYTPAEVKQLHVWDWDRNWSREKVLSAIRELGPEGTHFETQHTRKDGTRLEVELSNSVAQLGGRRLAFCICHDVTERKRAMAALAMREQIFSTIVGQATDAIAVVDGRTGRFVEFNASAHDGLGYTREEFLGFGVEDIQAEHSTAQIRANFESIIRSGSATFETLHRHKDGSLRDVRVSVRALRLHGNELMSAVWADLTDRKRAEARARRDNRRTEFLLELHRRAPQMHDQELWEHVLAHAVELTDSTTGVLLLVAPDQQTVRQTTWRKNGSGCGTATSRGDDLPLNAVGAWAECIRRCGSIVCPCARPCPEETGALEFGGERVSALMGVPVVEGGGVRWVLGVGGRGELYTDDDVAQLQLVANELHRITDQRSTQNQLRQLSQAVDQSPVSVVITDIHGAIEYTNPQFSKVTGYSAQEVRGRNPSVLKSGDQSEQSYRELWETVLAGRSWHGEFHNRKKNGEMFWESASISPILDPAGKLSHFVAVKEDITERKRLEAQLRQAQKLEAVGQLAGGVAHDFNNILAAIMMHLGLAQMNPGLDRETRETLKEIEVESARAASLTRQLLMFSRRSVLAMKPQDLNEVVANLLKMLSRLISENIRLRFEGASHLPYVEADAGMIEQVLLNLVVNARDAMPHGGSITIETAAAEVGRDAPGFTSDRLPGRFVRVSVSDTGVGMEEAIQRRIFEPFFTTKEAGCGTGLGLATVHGIVAQHKGWVEVESSPGNGSTFRVYLPAMAQALEMAAVKEVDAPLPGGRETILVVEDEARLRQLMARTLRGLGYCVHEAENGQDAMRLWQQAMPRVDLLLTDMVMPEGMTGLELAERLLAAKPGLKIIITSGYSSEIVHAGLPAKSGVTYLPKPFLDRTLADVVRSCLDRKG